MLQEVFLEYLDRGNTSVNVSALRHRTHAVMAFIFLLFIKYLNNILTEVHLIVFSVWSEIKSSILWPACTVYTVYHRYSILFPLSLWYSPGVKSINSCWVAMISTLINKLIHRKLICNYLNKSFLKQKYQKFSNHSFSGVNICRFYCADIKPEIFGQTKQPVFSRRTLGPKPIIQSSMVCSHYSIYCMSGYIFFLSFNHFQLSSKGMEHNRNIQPKLWLTVQTIRLTNVCHHPPY